MVQLCAAAVRGLHPRPGMATRPDDIDPEAASELSSEGRVMFLDARPDAALAASGERIAGAVRVPPGAGAETDALLLALPREKLLVAYCDEPDHAASAAVARRARELGLGDACLLAGGLRGWKSAGLATERIPAPPAEALLASVSVADLGDLCRLAFWLGAGADARAWGEERDSRTAYLAGVAPDLLARFARFLDVRDDMGVPDDHVARVANLPERVRARARDLFGAVAVGDRDKDPLVRLVTPDESQVLLRWFAWTGEIPRRVAWWWTPFEERPA